MNLLSAASRSAAKHRAQRTLDSTYAFAHYEAVTGSYGSEQGYGATYATVKGRLSSGRRAQATIERSVLVWSADYVLAVLDGQSLLSGIKRGDKVTEAGGRVFYVEGWLEDVSGGGVTTIIGLNREARGGG